MKSRLVNVLKIVVTLALFAVILSQINVRVVGKIIAEANLAYFLAALLLYCFALLVGAFKWRILVLAQGIDASLGALLSFSLMGLFFGNVLPSNIGGDVVRAYDLARATRGQAEAAAISVLVDRLMGLVAFSGAAVVTTAIAAFWLVQTTVLTQVELAAVGFAVFFLVVCAILFSRRIARRFAFVFQMGPLTRLKPIAENVYRALQVYRFRYGALAANVACSVAIVVITAMVWFLVGRAVGITNVSFFNFLLFNPLIGFVLLVPISFNGLGAKEAAVVFFFGLVDVPQERAFAMSLLFHAIIVLTSLPGGFVWFAKRRQMPSTMLEASP